MTNAYYNVYRTNQDIPIDRAPEKYRRNVNYKQHPFPDIKAETTKVRFLTTKSTSSPVQNSNSSIVNPSSLKSIK